MQTRRRFLGSIAYPAGALAGATVLDPKSTARTLQVLSELAKHPGEPEAVAADESFWFEIQRAFPVNRGIVNLNNGGVCPSPSVVLDAMKRHLDFSNTAPAYAMWQIQEPQRETVRAGLARCFGCDPEEVAITRNASEGLEIVQNGLDLGRGDEVVTTSQDYPRMLSAFRQRERREGIVLKTFSIPVPCEDPSRIVSLFEEAVTPRTKMILICQVINLTGQILPVRDVVRMARGRGVPVLVDGAHAFAHLAFARDDLECDTYATSLHKWLCAPHGTGMLYVRKESIRKIWPLMAAAPEQDADIRKFEEIGTHPAANALAIAEALAFHEGIGPRRKEARLRHLRGRWARRLLESGRVKLHTSLKPEFSCGIGTVQVEGVDSGALNQHLWDKHRIFTVAIKHADFEGIRVTPNVYTTEAELERFCDAVFAVIRHGLPAA